MKICFMNCFETTFQADFYIACLPVDRPIIHPGKPLINERYLVLEHAEHSAKNKNHLKSLPEVIKKKFNLRFTHDLDSQAPAASKTEPIQLEWIHCDISELLGEISDTFLDLPVDRNIWHIFSYSTDDVASGMWIFKNHLPILFLPLGTCAGMCRSLTQDSRWHVDKQGIAVLTLRNYFEILASQKVLFSLDNGSPENLSLLALIRYLLGETLLYGKADLAQNVKHLKFFKFMTHDLPLTGDIKLSLLGTYVKPFINALTLEDIIEKKSTAYLKSLQ